MLRGSVRIIIDPEDGEEGVDSRPNILSYIDTGLCDASVIDRDTLDTAQAGGEHCNKTHVGDPVLALPRGFPVYRGVQAAMRTGFVELASDSTWSNTLRAADGTSTCRVQKASKNELQPADMFAAFILASFFGVLGLIVSVIMNGRKVKKVSDPTGHNPDPNPTPKP